MRPRGPGGPDPERAPQEFGNWDCGLDVCRRGSVEGLERAKRVAESSS